MPRLAPIALAGVVLGLLVAKSWSVEDAYHYEVSGLIEETQFGSGMDTPLRRQSMFTASVVGCRWFIRLVPHNWPHPPPIVLGTNRVVPVVPRYLESGSDGQNFYRVMAFHDPGDEPTAPRNRGTAVRGPGTIPFAIGDEIMALWYIFASHCYLGTLTNMLIAPIESLPTEIYKDGFVQVPGQILRDGAPPGLPRFASALGYVLKNDTEGVRLEPATVPLTNVHLTVALFTNRFGLSIPLDASVDYFRTRGRSGQFHVVYRKRLRVLVESLAADCPRTTFVPEVPQPSTITDLRVYARAKRSALVFGTNWLSEQALFERVEALPRRPARAQHFSRAVLILLCGLIILPVVYAVLSKSVLTRKTRYEPK